MNGYAWLHAVFHYHWGWWECTGVTTYLVYDPATTSYVSESSVCVACPDARNAVAAALKDWKPRQ
jgi:hypothetical protein